MDSTEKQNQTNLYGDRREELFLSDFKLIGKIDGAYHLSYDWDSVYEICLEPCLDGFDVGIYRNKNLLEQKRCTNMSTKTDIEWSRAIIKAVMIANELYKNQITN